MALHDEIKRAEEIGVELTVLGKLAEVAFLVENNTPLRGAELASLRALLAHIDNTQKAQQFRLAGEIPSALMCERKANHEYKKLPSELRW